MGLAYGTASTFKLKPELTEGVNFGLASDKTLASDTTLASDGNETVPLVEANFVYSPVGLTYGMIEHLNTEFLIPNVTNEFIKQGLRDLNMFIEEESA
jgi:hypothetical protein